MLIQISNTNYVGSQHFDISPTEEIAKQHNELNMTYNGLDELRRK